MKWNERRIQGDLRYDPSRFGFQYYDIYRSTQDLDIVIDGTEAQAQALQKSLAEKFNYLQGSKSAWEVRLLRRDSQGGEKEALLDNPSFQNQNSDSNSTGMIEISDPPVGESRIRDVREFENPLPTFLKDVLSDHLTYYYSPESHAKTKRYLDGLNPPIFSAIRALTKAFQFQLQLGAEDIRVIRRVIEEFDPKRDLANPRARAWIEKNAPKLYQHAVNLEYAGNVMRRLGLIEKLAPLGGELQTWMRREPLRSQQVGQGPVLPEKIAGRTAAALGITEVAHETNSFLAYESITRSPKGEPNVFISRAGAPNELAAYGDGFYTRRGREGARGTGWTIRFKVDPSAQEGVDFFVAGGDYVVFRNKRALAVIGENLNLGVLQYFELLEKSPQLNLADRGILEKMKLHLRAGFAAMDSETEAKLVAQVRRVIGQDFAKTLVREWLSLPISGRHPELIRQGLAEASEDVHFYLIQRARAMDRPEFEREALRDVIAGIQDPLWPNRVIQAPQFPADAAKRQVSLDGFRLGLIKDATFRKLLPDPDAVMRTMVHAFIDSVAKTPMPAGPVLGHSTVMGTLSTLPLPGDLHARWMAPLLEKIRGSEGPNNFHFLQTVGKDLGRLGRTHPELQPLAREFLDFCVRSGDYVALRAFAAAATADLSPGLAPPADWPKQEADAAIERMFDARIEPETFVTGGTRDATIAIYQLKTIDLPSQANLRTHLLRKLLTRVESEATGQPGVTAITEQLLAVLFDPRTMDTYAAYQPHFRELLPFATRNPAVIPKLIENLYAQGRDLEQATRARWIEQLTAAPQPMDPANCLAAQLSVAETWK